MGAVLTNLLILVGVIAIIEIPKHLLKVKNNKVINFLSYLLMGVLSFVAGKYLLNNFSFFTNTLAISFIILAFITILSKRKNSEV